MPREEERTIGDASLQKGKTKRRNFAETHASELFPHERKKKKAGGSGPSYRAGEPAKEQGGIAIFSQEGWSLL